MNRIQRYFYASVATLLAGSFLRVNAQQYTCQPAPPNPKYKILTIDASTMGIAEGTLQYENNDSVWVVVKNINPFVSTYTLKIKRTAVAETAIASFLGDIGGIPTDFLPKQSPKPSQPSPSDQPSPNLNNEGPTCSISVESSVLDKFNQFGIHRDEIAAALARVTSAYVKKATELKTQVEIVQAASQCAKIQTEANTLRTALGTILSPDQMEAATFHSTANDQDPIQALQGEITQLLTEAKGVRTALLGYRRQVAIHPECDNQSQIHSSQLQEEERFVDEFLGPTAGIPESQVFQNQLNNLKSKYMQFSQARAALDKLFDRSSSDNPFVLTKAITDKQADDEITLEAGAPVTLISGQSTKPNASPGPPASTPTKTTSSSKTAFDETIHFGYGPKFTISGGVVASFLRNKQYTTANGLIAFQNNSATRIGPIALLNSRFYDCNPVVKGPKCLAVPQISLGITAKSDDKGTSPEFLIGPSWAFIDRQLFIAVGAYAGQQQRLLGGLAVGQLTTLSSANLPIAKEYHWSGAISITWKIK